MSWIRPLVGRFSGDNHWPHLSDYRGLYMHLLNIHGQYFWVASQELCGEPPSPEIATKTRELAWRIADKLRKTDRIPHLQDILTVLMSEDAYKSANDRAKAMLY